MRKTAKAFLQENKLITLRSLSVGYDAKPLITNFNVVVPVGSLVAVVGRNGCGKSTLLRTLGGLQPPLAGQIFFGEEEISDLIPADLARRVAFVLAGERVADALLVRDVLTLGTLPYARLSGMSQRKLQLLEHETACRLRIENLLEHRMSTLSDGQRQRVMLARAIVQQTPVLLADEPTAFLDFPAKREIFDLLVQMTSHEGRTVIVSTHDLYDVLPRADSVWLLEEGRLLIGTPEDQMFRKELQRGLAYDPIGE